MRVITSLNETTFRAKTEVIFPDRVEHLAIMEDEQGDGVYVFIWRTQRYPAHTLGKVTYELVSRVEREGDLSTESELVHVWQLVWRGNLGQCLTQLGEVHGDLLLEQANVAQLSS